MKGPILLATMALSSFFFALAPASAQSCPAGTTPSPGGPGGAQPCISISDYSGGNSSSQGPKYATRWGAIAGDASSGKIGIAGSQTSKGKAEKAAIEHCLSKGGKKCVVEMTYYNQCAVVTYGGGYMNTSSAPTLEEASQNALRVCGMKSSDCKVYFSDCSYAELVG